MGRSLGKLKAAALWLLTPADSAAGHDDQAEAQLRRLGVPDAEIDAARQAQAAADVAADAAQGLELWAWHLDALRLFKAMRSQWRMVGVGMGGVLHTGLVYEALPMVEERLGLKPSQELFEQLQTMERAGRIYLNQA